jgi:hypothetical protein
MSFTRLTGTQLQFLEGYLRGTNRSLSSAQARATYGIMNLRARMSELRSKGLRVRRVQNLNGHSSYQISARDQQGSRKQAIV